MAGNKVLKINAEPPTQDDLRMCSLVRHAWDLLGVESNVQRQVWRHSMRFRCVRCLSERFDPLDAYGELVKSARVYEYSDAYRDWLDSERPPTTADLRLVFVQGEREKRRARESAS